MANKYKVFEAEAYCNICDLITSHNIKKIESVYNEKGWFVRYSKKCTQCAKNNNDNTTYFKEIPDEDFYALQKTLRWKVEV